MSEDYINKGAYYAQRQKRNKSKEYKSKNTKCEKLMFTSVFYGS